MSGCKTCKYFIPVRKHPWNNGDAKGDISEQFGHVCTGSLSEGADFVVFNDRDGEGLGCELQTEKEF